jgi:hypothetical protein
MPSAEWTIMVFLNGDNNLENFGLIDFREMAKIDYNEKINVVVQFDRNGHFATTSPQWRGCYRFKIAKGMKPLPSEALSHLGDTNMGSGTTLRNFVDWAMAAYPAKKYMLDIWNHGQGWRFFRAQRPAVSGLELSRFLDFRSSRLEREAERRSVSLAQLARKRGVADVAAAPMQAIPLGMTVPGTVRSVSSDDTSGDVLYNREVQDSLAGVSLDLFGFDACLMGMVETAYALRSVAKVMVGSEDLEPGDGWDYTDWLGRLTADPEMEARDLGKAMVESYAGRYQGLDEATTLSAIDLSYADDLAATIDSFADALTATDPAGFAGIKAARLDCEEFAPGYGLHGIDLARFAERVGARVGPLGTVASEVANAVARAVIANHVGEERKGNFGASGLAIYFPENKANFQADPDHEGYLKANAHYPVQFVQNHRWADFLLGRYLPTT